MEVDTEMCDVSAQVEPCTPSEQIYTETSAAAAKQVEKTKENSQFAAVNPIANSKHIFSKEASALAGPSTPKTAENPESVEINTSPLEKAKTGKSFTFIPLPSTLKTTVNLESVKINTGFLEKAKEGKGFTFIPSLAGTKRPFMNLDISPLQNRHKRQENVQIEIEQEIRTARNALVRAASLASANDSKQKNILDLLKVFRDFIEHGRVSRTDSASKILATQVASLKQATKKIATQARQTDKPSYATAAAANIPKQNPFKGPLRNQQQGKATQDD